MYKHSLILRNYRATDWQVVLTVLPAAAGMFGNCLFGATQCSRIMLIGRYLCRFRRAGDLLKFAQGSGHFAIFDPAGS